MSNIVNYVPYEKIANELLRVFKNQIEYTWEDICIEDYNEEEQSEMLIDNINDMFADYEYGSSEILDEYLIGESDEEINDIIEIWNNSEFKSTILNFVK
jgi:hypothetical protein